MVEFIRFYSIGIINYFPSGLEKFFTKLLKIEFQSVEMKEIHASDLKPFAELEILYLDGNHFEYLEKGLFKFNQKLRAFSVTSNSISYIDPNIFDHLSDLSCLWLDGNVCKLPYVDNNPIKVREIIKNAKENCSNVMVLLDAVKVKMLNEMIENVEQVDRKHQKLHDQNSRSIEQLQGTMQRNFTFTYNKIQTLQYENSNSSLKLLNIDSKLQNDQRKSQEIFKKLQDSMQEKFNKSQNSLKELLATVTANDKKISQRMDALEQLKISNLNMKTENSLITLNRVVFIAIPVFLFFTILNIFLIIACFRKRINLHIQSNNEEIEASNLNIQSCEGNMEMTNIK